MYRRHADGFLVARKTAFFCFTHEKIGSRGDLYKGGLMTVQAQILEMVKLVPDNDLPTLMDVLRRFVPVDSDDSATADDLAAHEATMREYLAGENYCFRFVQKEWASLYRKSP